MAQILNRSPFDEYVWEHTIPQMDFILEQYAADNPDKLKFHRAVEREYVKDQKSWTSVLHGDALLKWLGKLTNMDVINRLARKTQQDHVATEQLKEPKPIVQTRPPPVKRQRR